MENIATAKIHEFLTTVGQRYPEPAELFLLGGSALCLLGSIRVTLDIDYVGHDLQKTDIQLLIEQIAEEMQIDVEPVPIEEFVPLPDGAGERKIHMGRFGTIDVYVIDPYTIALSKIDRGIDTDIEDVVFLIQQHHITLHQLENVVSSSLEKGHDFGLNRAEMEAHLHDLRSMLTLK